MAVARYRLMCYDPLMVQTKPTDGLSKFQRYRKAQHRRGMKLLRIWVPDPHSPGFNKEIARQAKLLKGQPDEEEVMRFIEATAAWPEE